LKVIYNNGLVRCYSALDGSVISEVQGEKPDSDLSEEFYTDNLKIVSPLHGTPVVYDIKTGKQVGELAENAYLTYVTQVGENIITEYVTTEGERYGLLMNEKCETLAELPGLCDVLPDGNLVFDDNRGNLRQSCIYSIQELLALAKNN
jgi:nitrite reductase/ring-hydroxylating ferredoxin subunit